MCVCVCMCACVCVCTLAMCTSLHHDVDVIICPSTDCNVHISVFSTRAPMALLAMVGSSLAWWGHTIHGGLVLGLLLLRSDLYMLRGGLVLGIAAGWVVGCVQGAPAAAYAAAVGVGSESNGCISSSDSSKRLSSKSLSICNCSSSVNPCSSSVATACVATAVRSTAAAAATVAAAAATAGVAAAAATAGTELDVTSSTRT